MPGLLCVRAAVLVSRSTLRLPCVLAVVCTVFRMVASALEAARARIIPIRLLALLVRRILAVKRTAIPLAPGSVVGRCPHASDIVLSLQSLIGQNVVRDCDLLKPLLIKLVLASVRIRMVLFRQLVELLLNFLMRRVALQPQALVVVDVLVE